MIDSTKWPSNSRFGLLALAMLFTLLVSSRSLASGALTFEGRVWAETQLARIRYERRTWPADNPAPKPAFEKAVPAAAIEARVKDVLEESAALERFWQRAITPEMLQAEIDRMQRGSKDKNALQSMFAALHHDPSLIAEALARPLLADRMMHTWYERDGIDATAVEKPGFDDWWDGVRATIPASSHDLRGFDFVYRIGAAGALVTTADPCEQWTHPAALVEGLAEGRMTHTAVWTGTEMIIWGGHAGRLLASGARYDPATDSWTPVSQGPNTPIARRYHVAVWTGTEMIVWGGHDSAGNALQDGGRYNPATDTWTPVATGANAPAGRQQCSVVWTGTEMIVWGGLQGNTYLNSGGRYDPASDSWTETSIGANVPLPRIWHTAVWTGTEMIVWGGASSLNPLLGAGGRYNPATDSWTPHTTTGQPAARYQHIAVWTGLEMIVWGGANNTGTFFNSGARYDPVADTWTATPATGAPPVRTAPLAVWTGTQLVVWGGTNSTAQFLTTGGKYIPSLNLWVATSTANVPDGRDQATAVWSGSEMIVWGGRNTTTGGDLLKSGGRYNPVTDAWVPTAIGTNLPSGRSGEPPVWTGNELLVWGGGSVGSGATNTGARYEPATDAWLPLSHGANVPAGRTGHTAVWTGTQMIVWGGLGSGYLASGGRYDPATDSWLATSVGTNVPLGRSNHTAIWTGTQMVVWGGVNGSIPQDSGGRYNPTTDVWSPTSLTNPPSGRQGHSAVWTGTEMIVWGGGPSTTISFVNTGGRYNPATNVWTATSTGANVPAARIAHTSVWTGSEMIVWGGNAGTASAFNNGARYAPATDTWSAVSLGAAVPSPRFGHSAVWTGTEMFVWGGGNGSTKFADGSRYNPTADVWNALSTLGGPPSPRWKHLAVWTGTNMIVWGGAGNGIESFPANGGIYEFAVPGSPGNTLRVNKTASTVELTWGTIADADYYNVKRCGGPAPCLPGAVVDNPAVASYSEPLAPLDSHFYVIETANACATTP